MSISSPERTPESRRVFETLAAAEAHGLTLRTGLLAAIVADHADLAPADAVDLATGSPFDPRVRDAGVTRDVLVVRAGAALLAAEYAEDDANRQRIAAEVGL